MQRTEPDGMIVIACDFCLRDWDGQEAMVEGHHGSVICVPCLQKAIRETQNSPPSKLKLQNDEAEETPNVAPEMLETAREAPGVEAGKFGCTLCLRRFESSTAHWTGVAGEGGVKAMLCAGCIKLATRTFAKSPLTEWDGTV